MFLLDKLEEGWHVRPSKVVDRLQAGEHTPLGQPLEVVLANVLERKENNFSWGD